MTITDLSKSMFEHWQKTLESRVKNAKAQGYPVTFNKTLNGCEVVLDGVKREFESSNCVHVGEMQLLAHKIENYKLENVA